MNHSAWSKFNYALGQFTTFSTSRVLPADLAYADLVLQIFGLTIQFVAYPIIQYAAEEGVAQVQVIQKKKAAK